MNFTKLNSFGETPGKPSNRPTSKIGQNNQKQVGVLYGHNGGGKVYNYLGGAGLRVGDTVTPEVTHYKSGKTYKTLGRVVSTKNATGGSAAATAGHLSGQGIMLKKLGSTDQKSLPGYYDGWKKDADARYEQTKMQRLNSMGKVKK